MNYRNQKGFTVRGSKSCAAVWAKRIWAYACSAFRPMRARTRGVVACPLESCESPASVGRACAVTVAGGSRCRAIRYAGAVVDRSVAMTSVVRYGLMPRSRGCHVRGQYRGAVVVLVMSSRQKAPLLAARPQASPLEESSVLQDRLQPSPRERLIP